MIVQHQRIPLIARSIHPEQPGYWSIFFEWPSHFTFAAGDWIDVQFDNQQLTGGTTYSISSAPTESEIRITFREGVSEFKRALRAIQPGQRVYITQYGNDYGFQLKQHQASTLIAGGVGIAPFRSMLKQRYDTKSTSQVTLLYLHSHEPFIFEDELQAWAKADSQLSVRYIATKDISRKKREKLILAHINNSQQNFYIAGPPSMVESNEHLLIAAGVKVSDIRIDSFGGY